MDVEALKQLALLGGLDHPVEIASAEFARLLELSQQSGSRRLIELAEAHLIQREMGVRKQRIQITPAGRAVLEAEHQLYERLFAPRGTIEVRGTVKTGLGEGRYYLSRPGYKDRFRAFLGWEPYPGTLNLELAPSDVHAVGAMRRFPQHVVPSFQAEGRTFGGVNVNSAAVGAQACAAILPHRTHYTTTVELIAPLRLRDAIPCQDGDELRVQIELGKASA